MILQIVENIITKIQVFPNNILAKIFGFKEENMFEITNEEKDNVKVEL